MRNDVRTADNTREFIVGFLSDHELASASTGGAAASLSYGDEFVDLDELERGVQRALGAATPTGSVLPRSAVSENTWANILGQLGASCIVRPAHLGVGSEEL